MGLKGTNAIIGVLCMVFCSLTGSDAKAQAASVRGVFGTGGGTVQDANHRLSGTFGQPLAGKTTGPSNESQGGFWYTIEQVVEVTDSPTLPTVYSLDQNHPNPFGTTTTITYGLPTASVVDLAVYDVQGRLAAKPTSEHQTAGYYELELRAERLAPGIYFYRLTAGNFVATRKMVLVK
jgi:hypothetical protein